MPCLWGSRSGYHYIYTFQSQLWQLHTVTMLAEVNELIKLFTKPKIGPELGIPHFGRLQVGVSIRKMALRPQVYIFFSFMDVS